MAFDLRNLSRLAFGNGFTLWAYRAAPGENMAIVDVRTYFANHEGMMSPGDAIMVSDDDGTELVTPFPRGHHAVRQAEEGVFVTRRNIDSLAAWIASIEAVPEAPNPWGKGYDLGLATGARVARTSLIGGMT